MEFKPNYTTKCFVVFLSHIIDNKIVYGAYKNLLEHEIGIKTLIETPV